MQLIGTSKDSVHLAAPTALPMHRLTLAAGTLQVRDFASGYLLVTDIFGGHERYSDSNGHTIILRRT